MKIVAVDPGGTTGICQYDSETQEVFQCQLGPDEHHLTLWDLLSLVSPDVVVCEQFNYQRRDLTKGVSLRLDSREYIGVCKLYRDSSGCRLVMQQPSYMGLWTDKKLKAVNLYRPGMPHANDATRHFLYYETVVLRNDKWLRAAREPE